MKQVSAFIWALGCALTLAGCSSVSASEEARDLIPMVMVDGTLYLDTGRVSAEVYDCGMPDGEITSEVPQTERPTADGQSNFGTGYAYRHTGTDGMIEIRIRDTWFLYASEAARDSSPRPEGRSSDKSSGQESLRADSSLKLDDAQLTERRSRSAAPRVHGPTQNV